MNILMRVYTSGEVLINWINHYPMTESEFVSAQNWVNVKEAAEVTGYHPRYVRKIAHDNWSKPESERDFRIHRHSNGYMIWLPDLLKYAEEPHQGPRAKPKSDKY